MDWQNLVIRCESAEEKSSAIRLLKEKTGASIHISIDNSLDYLIVKYVKRLEIIFQYANNITIPNEFKLVDFKVLDEFFKIDFTYTRVRVSNKQEYVAVVNFLKRKFPTDNLGRPLFVHPNHLKGQLFPSLDCLGIYRSMLGDIKIKGYLTIALEIGQILNFSDVPECFWSIGIEEVIIKLNNFHTAKLNQNGIKFSWRESVFPIKVAEELVNARKKILAFD